MSLRVAKYLTVLMTGITNLLLLIGGISLYEERSLAGYGVAFLYLFLTMLDTGLYLWILEKIIKTGKKN